MDTKELLAKVRRIEIKTKTLSGNIFSGQYHSSFKGKGMIFSEVRGYEIGDDIRNIDWNVTAKLSEPHVKSFEEEREMTVMLAVDISQSVNFGSTSQIKRDVLVEICATIAFSAMMNNDKVGLLLFSDKIEKYIPPAKGKKHILRILRDLLDTESETTGTNISEAADYICRLIKKRSIVFMLSDFMDSEYMNSMKLLAKRHTLTGLKIRDRLESNLPKLGYFLSYDMETKQRKYINTFLPSVRRQWKAHFDQYEDYYTETFVKIGARYQSIYTDDDYIKALVKIFS